MPSSSKQREFLVNQPKKTAFAAPDRPVTYENEKIVRKEGAGKLWNEFQEFFKKN